ncbi:hypothetical protein BG011_006966 [Mortierella polycephala]|uniref:Galactose oxidase n=1 Tax=Mortierella polycephala TaxID=41804 RepID=A0A9P6QAZ4_9FUNG|nr:hypothetical protein BG011_006966 [Mortierella polycephala]
MSTLSRSYDCLAQMFIFYFDHKYSSNDPNNRRCCCSELTPSPRRRKRPVQRQRSKFPAALPTVPLLIFCALVPSSVHPQQSSTSTYTPRYSAGSSIANNVLYIVSGTVSIAPPYQSTSDIFALPLHTKFTANNIPWKKLKAGYFVQDAIVTTTVDQQQLVVAGVADQPGQLVVVYNIQSNSWSNLSSTAVVKAKPHTPRTYAGMVLNPNTKQIVLYGGLFILSDNGGGGEATGSKTYRLSIEFDYLNTMSAQLDEWVWSAIVESSSLRPPSLVQPIMLYLPTRQAILMMGGCGTVDIQSGVITGCESFSTGYLFISNSGSNAASDAKPASIEIISLIGASLPPPRLSPCAVVLSNGDVFMYGGAASNTGMHDVWVLETGFDGGLAGPRQFSDPQVAVINTTSWAWTTHFTPSPGSLTNNADTGSSGLSSKVTIGLIIGGSMVLSIMFFILGFMIWRYRKYKRHNNHHAGGNKKSKHTIFQIERGSRSMEPLMAIDDGSTTGLRTESVSMAPLWPSASNKQSRTSIRPKEGRIPLLIVPYAPKEDLTSTVSWTSSTPTPTSTGSSPGFASSVHSDFMVSNSTDHKSRNSGRIAGGSLPSSASPSQSEFFRGDRLSKDDADIQQGHYAKTLQHHRQYEKRREQEAKQNPYLGRSGTHYTFMEDMKKHGQGHGYGRGHGSISRGTYGDDNDGDDDQDGLDLATAMIALKEVDLGEDPIREGEATNVEDGTILLSSHLDTTQLDNRYL